MHYAAVDIGSPVKGNMGWAVMGDGTDVGGTDAHDLIGALADAARKGPMVLGFEAPMYVPAKREMAAILKARPGEGSRAWSVAAGATTTAIGLAVVPWVLDKLAEAVPEATAWQDWTRIPTRPGEVLVFEAFVSGGPSDGHIADARAAARAAKLVIEGTKPVASALAPEHCISVLGAAILHARLSTDIEELRRNCLVVRAAKAVSATTI